MWIPPHPDPPPPESEICELGNLLGLDAEIEEELPELESIFSTLEREAARE
jgi:hypothetical protein